MEDFQDSQLNVEESQLNELTTIDVQQIQEDYSMDVQQVQNDPCSSLDVQQNQGGSGVAYKKKGKLLYLNYFKC